MQNFSTCIYPSHVSRCSFLSGSKFAIYRRGKHYCVTRSSSPHCEWCHLSASSRRRTPSKLKSSRHWPAIVGNSPPVLQLTSKLPVKWSQNVQPDPLLERPLAANSSTLLKNWLNVVEWAVTFLWAVEKLSPTHSPRSWEISISDAEWDYFRFCAHSVWLCHCAELT